MLALAPDGPLRVAVDGRVALLTLHDPPQNPVGIEQVEGLEAVTAAIAAAADPNAADPDDPAADGIVGVRAVVLTGSGANFCAGANIKQFGRVGREETPDGFLARRQAMVSALEALPVPVIAAVAGNALGGGFELALGCHFRIADETARFGLPEIRLGLLPAWGGTQRLARLVAPDVALRLLLTGEPMDATDALSRGMVTEVVPAGGAVERALALAHRLAAGPRIATAAILDAVLRGGRTDLAAGLEIELAGVRRARGSAENREGVAAFLEKRPPRFG